MSEAILVALITGTLALIGNIISGQAVARKQERQAAVSQAITDTKLDELTREVREHNHFAIRMPALEQEVHDIERRVSILETYHKAPTN